MSIPAAPTLCNELGVPRPIDRCGRCFHPREDHVQSCVAWVDNAPPEDHGCNCPGFEEIGLVELLQAENAAMREYIKSVHHVVEPMIGILRMRKDGGMKERADRARDVMTPSNELMAIIRGA